MSNQSDKNDIKVLAGVICIVLVYAVVVSFHSKSVPGPTQMQLPVRNDVVPQVPMLQVFANKIVYTTDITSPKDDYINDCETRGGMFNTCDTGCDIGVTKCAITCAYTCTTPVTPAPSTN